jgi:hypothetical protein
MDDVVICQADASARHRGAYRPWLVCAVQTEHCVEVTAIEIERTRAEWIVQSAWNPTGILH